MRSTPGAVDPLFESAVVERPHEYYAQLRDLDPVHHVSKTGAFLVTRMDLIHEVIGDPALYSSDTIQFLHLDSDGHPELWTAGSEMIEGLDIPTVLATADPPDHTRQRRVFSKLFTRSAIERRAEQVKGLVDAMLDPHLEGGEMDWMRDLAVPLPAIVLSRLLGLDDEAAQFVRDFGYASGEQISGFASEERVKEIQSIISDLGPVADAYGNACSEEHPDLDTVLGVCAQAVRNGDLSDLEALITLLLLVSAGSESTTSLIGTGACILAQDQALQDRLRKSPELVETFVEEACRIDPPFRGHYRRVTRDTTLGGVSLPEDARVVLVWPAANRDGATFDCPDQVDLDRSAPRQHVGFGWGIHLCLGAPLARMEARVAFERLLARTTHFELDMDEQELRHHHSLLVRRLVRVSLKLSV
jgi:cytochrome P450